MGEVAYPSHPPVVVVLIFISRLSEGKGAIITGHVTSETDQHLQHSRKEISTNTREVSLKTHEFKHNRLSHFSKRRMDIEKEGPVDVVASHLPKVRLVPAETPKKKQKKNQAITYKNHTD